MACKITSTFLLFLAIYLPCATVAEFQWSSTVEHTVSVREGGAASFGWNYNWSTVEGRILDVELYYTPDNYHTNHTIAKYDHGLFLTIRDLKYTTVNGTNAGLTVLNVTHADEGVYFVVVTMMGQRNSISEFSQSAVLHVIVEKQVTFAGLQWLSTVERTVSVCKGGAASFGWNFNWSTVEGRIVTVELFYTPDNYNTNHTIASYSHGLFLTNEDTKYNTVQGTNAGLTVQNVTQQDEGVYFVLVTMLSDRNSFVESSQSAVLHVIVEKQGVVGSSDKFCNDHVSCPFDSDTCGFLPSADWTWQGSHERFENTVTASTDLRSPAICTGPMHVQFSSHVTTALGQNAELIVLTECDGVDLWGQPMQGLVGPLTSWGAFNFTLPACPDGRVQRVVFRALKADPGSVFLLDDVNLLSSGSCNREVECHFEHSTCGFIGSSDWTMENGQCDRHQRFENVRSESTDLRSLVLCNGEVHVQFSGHVTGQLAELVVLTECDGADLWGQPMQGLRGPLTSWGAFNFTLPACPDGQVQRVVFRAVRVSPGSVIRLDDIILKIN